MNPAAILDWLRQRVASELEVPSGAIEGDVSVAALGVDSLAAAALSYEIKERFDVKMSHSEILSDRTLIDVAAEIVLRFKRPQLSTVPPAVAEGELTTHLSVGQRALWYLQSLSPDETAYNLAVAIHLPGALDTSALRRAVHHVVSQHEMLRASCVTSYGEPAFRILDGLDLRDVDASDWTEPRFHQASQGLVDEPFGFNGEPLCRLQLYRRGPHEHILFVCAHHIITDFTSLEVVLERLQDAYRRDCAGQPPVSSAATHRYEDYVRWQREHLESSTGQGSLNYWLSELADAPEVVVLPTDRPRRSERTYEGDTYAFAIEPSLAESVKRFAKSRDCTPFTVLLAAYQVLLHRHSGQQDLVVGSPTDGRGRSQFARTVGYFANMVPFRADFSSDPSTDELIKDTRRRVLGALTHQSIPFPLLVEKLAPRRDSAHAPLVQAVFSFERPGHRPGGAPLSDSSRDSIVPPEPGMLHADVVARKPRHVAFDLCLRVREMGDALRCELEYATELFERDTVRRLAERFSLLLETMVADPERAVAELPLLTEEESAQWIRLSTDTVHAYPQHKCLHELFEEQARRQPDAVALTCDAQDVTYQELDQWANGVARVLVERGVRSDHIVPVLAGRTVEMVVGMLAAMKAGGAYLSIDPGTPNKRIELMLKDMSATAVLVEPGLEPLLESSSAPLVVIDRALDADNPPPNNASANDLAYAIYTSGSTGQPKAVVVPHRAITRLFFGATDVECLCSDVVGLAASFSFDVSAGQLWGALVRGARVVLLQRETLLSPRSLRRRILDEQITLMDVTPSLFNAVVRELPTAFKTLRVLILAGEPVDPRWVRKAFDAGPPGRVVNAYGPTEAAVYTTTWVIAEPPEQGASVPIGQPVPNTRVYVLDPRLRPTPIGVPGEIYIGGAAVARGYYGRPDFTAERFVKDSFCGDADARMYRTGDLARVRADGNLEFLGRTDHQVKIRGHRVELQEIEWVLSSLSAVAEAAVTVFEPVPGDRRLVAHVVLEDGQSLSPDRIRRDLRKELPVYMIPSYVLFRDSLPITPNGKVSRGGLPDPDTEHDSGVAVSQPPASELETTLAELWAQTLGVSAVGRNDDFFCKGGDSLRALRLASRISHTLSTDVSVRTLLRHATVAEMAEFLSQDDAHLAGRSSAPPRMVPSTRPVSLHIDTKPLLERFKSGELAPVHSAALACLPSGMASQLGLTSDEIAVRWFNGAPGIGGVDELSLGRIAVIILPITDTQLHNTDDLSQQLIQAVRLARDIGASVVSLTGLLPSASGYGQELSAICEREGLPRITTGHATTVASVVMNICHLVAASERDLSNEAVGFLGMGSIGTATMRLLLDRAPHPRSLILSDVFGREHTLEQLAAQVREESGFTGEIEVLTSRGDAPEAFYRSTLMVGATSVPNVLDVGRLQPGTLVIDDSAPHCLNARQALLRLERHRDILLTEGGFVRGPEPIEQLRRFPEDWEQLSLAAQFGYCNVHDPSRITGCILSSLLCDRFSDLPVTVGGSPSLRASRAHYEKLQQLGFRAATLHFSGRTLEYDSES